MSNKTRDQLKQIFVTGAKPNETNFHDWLDSFRQVGESITIDNVTGLSDALNNAVAGTIQNQTSNYQNASFCINGTGTMTNGIYAGYPNSNTTNTFYGIQNILNNNANATIRMVTQGVGLSYDTIYDGNSWTAYNALNENRAAFPPAGSIKITNKLAIGDAQHIVNINGADMLIVDKTGATLSGVNEYSDNAGALAAGLTIGRIYRTGDTLKIVH